MIDEDVLCPLWIIDENDWDFAFQGHRVPVFTAEPFRLAPPSSTVGLLFSAGLPPAIVNSTRRAGAQGGAPNSIPTLPVRNDPERVPTLSIGTSRRADWASMSAWFYILRLRSGNPYLGSTRNILRRVKQHFDGKGGRTTTCDPPLGLVLSEEYDSIFEARRRELQVKRWTRAKKEALIAGDFARLKILAKRKKP